MHELSWKHEYEIGHPFIDHEHQHLFDIALEAFKPVAPEHRKQKIKDIITELNDYMKLHFEHEESFMRMIEYPDLHTHIVIHKSIIQSMKTMLKNLPNMHIKEFEKDLAYFIDSALVGHILDEDSKIQMCYQARKGQRHTITWNQDYMIGEGTIDSEHQRLFEVANEAFKLAEHEQIDKREVKTILLKLSSYIKEHFEHEEKYMKDIDYPHLQTHAEIHEKIITQLNSFIKDIITTDIRMFEFKLAIFIEKSLVQHIVHEDRKIKDFLNNEEVHMIDLENME